MYGELPLIQTTTGDSIPAFPVVVRNPPKTCALRLPTSDELLTYLSAQRSLYRDLGRRQGETEEVPNPKSDRKLFDAIRLDKTGVEFDDAEVAYAIGQVTRHRVSGCERDGDNYVVTLSTPLGDTTHTVRIPYQKEMVEYHRQSYKSRDLPHGVTEQRFPPEIPVRLYDIILITASGYAGTEPATEIRGLIPPHHKRAVVLELLSTLAALDSSLDPNS